MCCFCIIYIWFSFILVEQNVSLIILRALVNKKKIYIFFFSFFQF